MPYLPLSERKELLKTWMPKKPGELNFLITELFLRYWTNGTQNYQCLNDILGGAEGAKLEVYRRLAVPYENAKAASNGDLYEDIIE